MEWTPKWRLADDVNTRIIFDCLFAGIRGACIKYGATKQERECLKNKIFYVNCLINIKDNPPPEMLDKLEKYERCWNVISTEKIVRMLFVNIEPNSF